MARHRDIPDAREQDVRSVMFGDILRTIEYYQQTFPEYIMEPSTEQYKFLDGWLRVVTGEKQPEVVYLQRVVSPQDIIGVPEATVEEPV